MGLTVKHNRANYTHENEQFRRVASSLKILFNQKGWTGLLIGNPYNENYSRFRADAILLYDHGIILIDFKVYSGTLKLPRNKKDFEMSQWYTESDYDKKRIVVKAGNRFINPFKQLNSYREAFKEIVQSEDTLKNLIKENQTCALNIFSGPLIIENSIPKEIPFYKITQESDLGTFLYDYSSENRYSKEAADALLKIFNAEDWQEHFKLSGVKPLYERIFQIDKDVIATISNFLKSDESGILVLESLSSEERDNWVHHILLKALDFNIPQIETWIHSARIAQKVSLRLGIELQSLFNTIYGGVPKTLEMENVEQENKQNKEKLQKPISSGDSTKHTDNSAPKTLDSEDDKHEDESSEEQIQIIPIRSDDLIENSAVIILHEAHLVTRSLHQSEWLRFGSGRLLEDLLNFLRLDKTKRKLICIGDPYSLSYGKDTECAINHETLARLFNGKINYYRQQSLKENINGKLALRNILATGIEKKLFNELEYPWKSNDLLETDKKEIQSYLTEWFSEPLDSEPTNIVMVYSNKDAQKINHWIKNNCIKNGIDLAKNDLLLVNNNINIPNETGFEQPTKLYNGMFLLVEEVCESITEQIKIKLKQSNLPILLNFTKVKVKCLSFQNKITAEVWLLNNYLQSEDKLSKEEQIAFRVFVEMLISNKMKEQPFEKSNEYTLLHQDEEYKKLLTEVKDLSHKLLTEVKDLSHKLHDGVKDLSNKLHDGAKDFNNKLHAGVEDLSNKLNAGIKNLSNKLHDGEEVKTKLKEKQKEIKKIEKKFKKMYKNKILLNIMQTDPLANAVHAKYGWAITVHKSIGSTFTNAILNAYQGENRGITNAEYYKWLYSAVTVTTGILLIANPQTIHPLMNTVFEDTITNYNDSASDKKKFLSFKDYKVEDRFSKIIPASLNENVLGSVCELAKLLEKLGYLLESVNPINEYLTKAHFSIPSNKNRNLIININNKGEKDNWYVSSIKIEKSDKTNDEIINEYIDTLFNLTQENVNPFSLPTDFRGKIYEKWISTFSEKGFQLKLVESHIYQDIFEAVSIYFKAKFRVWYNNDGFISKIVMLKKSHENLGEDIKKWLIDGK